MADALTTAMRIGAVGGFATTYAAAPTIRDRFGGGPLVATQATLAGIGGGAAMIELADHAISGWARPMWRVDGDEAIHLVWARLGIHGGARNVALVTASAAMLGSLGLGFGSGRGDH